MMTAHPGDIVESSKGIRNGVMTIYRFSEGPGSVKPTITPLHSLRIPDGSPITFLVLAVRSCGYDVITSVGVTGFVYTHQIASKVL